MMSHSGWCTRQTEAVMCKTRGRGRRLSKATAVYGRLEGGAGQREEVDLLVRGGAAEDSVAVGISPEAADDFHMADCVGWEGGEGGERGRGGRQGSGSGGCEGRKARDGLELCLPLLGVHERHEEERLLRVGEALRQPPRQCRPRLRESPGVADKGSGRAPARVARHLVQQQHLRQRRPGALFSPGGEAAAVGRGGRQGSAVVARQERVKGRVAREPPPPPLLCNFAAAIVCAEPLQEEGLCRRECGRGRRQGRG
mmetsp:Transcript_20198/g.77342  ORF Transcript_20198/g.77342 Transcript_20198/m.77342 type:complete len:255 (+) Transcript_20198:86-850(+)